MSNNSSAKSKNLVSGATVVAGFRCDDIEKSTDIQSYFFFIVLFWFYLRVAFKVYGFI